MIVVHDVCCGERAAVAIEIQGVMAGFLDFFGGCPPVTRSADFRTSLFFIAFASGEGCEFEQVVATFTSPAAYRLEVCSGIVHVAAGIVGHVFKFCFGRESPACGACEICCLEIVQTSICFAIFGLVAIA